MTAELWNCTGAEYHADPSLSQSKLKLFIDSPEKYAEKYICPLEAPKPVPKHFVYGTDLERLLFFGETPGHLIPLECLNREEKDGVVKYTRRGTVWREYKDRMEAEHGPDVRLFKQEEWDKDILPTLIARDKIRAHDKAYKLVYGKGTPHMAFRWIDEATGLRCKCQLDMLYGWTPRRGTPQIIVDVKSAREEGLEEFEKAVGNFDYHIQAWWYREAVRMWCGLTLPFVFVVSRNNSPYTCETYDLDPDWYDIAEQEIKPAMERFATCQELYEESPDRTDIWVSPTHGKIATLKPKPWDYKRA